MSDFFDFPGRPDHPDFWTLSDILLEHDGATVEGGDTVASVMARIPLDADVVVYVASQRLGKLLGKDPKDPSLAVYIAIWIDAITAGARFAKRRGLTEEKGSE